MEAQTTYTWTGSTSSAWNIASNWSPAGIPGAADNAIILTAANAPVLDASRSITDLKVASGVLDLNGFTLTYTGNGTFPGGQVNNGTLAVNSTAGLLTFSAGCVLNAALTGTASDILFDGGTFNGPVTLTKTGSGNSVGNGGCTFNAALTLTTTGGFLYLSTFTPDVYNANVVVHSSGSGLGVIIGQNLSTPATLAAGATITAGTFTVGQLRIHNLAQLGGTAQTITLTGSAGLMLSAGNQWSGPVTVSAPSLWLHGGTYNAPFKATKTPGSNSQSGLGGNTYNASAEFINASDFNFRLAAVSGDVFNGPVLFGSTGAGAIYFGPGGAVLANGQTIGLSSSGFSSGGLYLGHFVQVGATPQSLTLTGTAELRIDTGSVFNAVVDFRAPTLGLSGGTFNTTASFTQTGAGHATGYGGNIYNGTTTISNTGTGIMDLFWYGMDQFNGDLILNNTNSGYLRLGSSSGSATLAAGRTVTTGTPGVTAGFLRFEGFEQLGSTPQTLVNSGTSNLTLEDNTVFNGPVTITSTHVRLNGATFQQDLSITFNGSGAIPSDGGNVFNGRVELIATGTGMFRFCESEHDAFNGDVVLSATNGGDIRFGWNGGTAALAAGRTLSIGAGGFASGILFLRNFTQLGTTPQSLSLGTGAILYFESGSVFNGDVVATSGGLLFNGTTFNGNGYFTKTGGATNNGSGGNVFNGTAEFVNTSSNILALHYDGVDQFNGDIRVNCTGTGSIWFGRNTGSATLASGRTVSVGALGFTSGQLHFVLFTQAGTTPQNIALGSGAALYFGPGSTFNGDVSATAGRMFFDGTTFNGNGVFTKTNVGSDNCDGGDVFNGSARFINTSTGAWHLNYSGHDQFNNNVVVENTSTGHITFGESGGTSTLASGYTISIGPLGFASGQLSFQGLAQLGSEAHTLTLGTAARLTFGAGTTFNGPVTATAGALYFNGTTFNGAGTFTKTGTTSDSSTGGNTFNGPTEFIVTADSPGSLALNDTGADAYNNNILVNSTSTGTIYFGMTSGSATLAPGYTISAGPLGFNAGYLYLRKFIQLGTTAQTLALGTSASLVLQTNTVFNGPLTVTAGHPYCDGATFNGVTRITKTGATNNSSAGGCTFNALAEFTVTGAGYLNLESTANDQFNGDILVNCTGTSTGGLWFGRGSGLGILASGRTVSVGAAGYANGNLVFGGFDQLGGTAQNLVLSSSGRLWFYPGCVFNGDLTTTSSSLTFNGGTFNGTNRFTKTGNTPDVGAGNCTFNGVAEFINTSASGTLNLDRLNPDVFNNNILVNSTGGGTITFGSLTGMATLASGYSIGVGATGYTGGTLNIRNFIQLGPAAQTLVLGSGAALNFQSGNVFNGPVTSSSGSFTLSGSTFNNTAKFTKTGIGNDSSTGGNVFNASFEVVQAGTGLMRLANTSGDQYNGNIRVNCTSGGQISFGYQATTDSQFAAGYTIAAGSSGFASGALNLCRFVQNGSTAQNLVLGTGATLQFSPYTVFNAQLTASSGGISLNGATFNGVSKFTKTGTANNNSTGGNIFNAQAEFVVSATGTWNLGYTASDVFNGNILVNSTANGSLGFGMGTADVTLGNGLTISVGATGFTAGSLSLRNFTQVGNTPQSLLLGSAASLYFMTGSTFQGPVVARAGNPFLNGTIFLSACTFQKTGSGGNTCSGGNTFQAPVELIVTGAGALGMAYTGTDVFQADLLLNSTGTGGITFGNSTGNATLGASAALGIGSTGFTAGTISFRSFNKQSTLPTVLSGGTATTLQFLQSNTFNGDLTTTTGNVFLSGTTFNGNCIFNKTDTSGNTSNGGNVFNGDVEINNSGAMTLAGSGADDYNGNVVFRRLGAGTMRVTSVADITFSKNVSTVGSTGSVLFGQAGLGRTIFDGTTTQTFSSDASAPPQVSVLVVNKSGGTLDLAGDVVVGWDIDFTAGVVRPLAATSTSNGLLILNSGISINDPADAGSHVDGFVRKIGNEAFTFPVGNAGIFAPITMSAPANATHHFTARYSYVDPDTYYDDVLMDPTLHHISGCEYWILDRTSGTSNVSVTLSFEDARSCGVTSLSDLRVARWNGSMWKDHGNGGTTGTTSSGTVVSAGAVTSFSPFTLASVNAMNPLPIELLSFTAVGEGPVVRTAWATATERNNERFEVERSADGETFTALGTVAGAGDSQSELHYSWVDEAPLSGLSYYRLKQVDFDGAFTYSDIVPVYRGGLAQEGVRVFPNPAVDQVTVALQRAVDGPVQVTLINAQGQVVSGTSRTIAAGEAAVQLPLEGLSPGIYLVRLDMAGEIPLDLRFMKR